jgi:hypothetical protein
MSSTPKGASRPPIADDLMELVIALTMPCARCGYDLRGLQADGDCPECGEPIRLTIIETIDPASRRLAPMHQPRIIGNAVTGVVASFTISFVLAIIALLIYAPETLPVPLFLRVFPISAVVWASAGFGFLSFLFLIPMMKMCQRPELVGCKGGILLTGFGVLVWSTSLLFIVLFFFRSFLELESYSMLFDTFIPVISAGLVFSGFRKLIPRLGLRSRAFRQAQGSRQRMNDLLAALVVVIVGRTLIQTAPVNSNLSILGLIIMIMSLSLILIGLGYLVHNTLWIRQALITPPPALNELLQPKP